jgi:quercetin dioxygenase-like cupin family protein
MLLVTIAPGASTEPERAHYGDECGIVLMGKIIINLGKEAYIAQAGDAFYYTANKKHSLENRSNKPAKILWISSPPSF